MDFNDKDEPFERPKNHNNPTKSDQPNHNSNDQTIIKDNNKPKKPLNLETKCLVCSQMFSNEEITKHAKVCAKAQIANSKQEKEQSSEDLQTFQNLADQQKSLSSKFMMSSDESVKFVIRRNNVVDDVMRKMNMFFKNSVIKAITVEFVGEEPIDDGGPLPDFTLYFTTMPLESYYMNLKKITRSYMMHIEMKVSFLSFQKVCCDWFVARSSSTAMFL